MGLLRPKCMTMSLALLTSYNSDCQESHSHEGPSTEQHPHYKTRHLPDWCAWCWACLSFGQFLATSIFRSLNVYISKGTIALWMDGDAMVDWLHTKYAVEVEKERDKERLKHISEQVRRNLLSVFTLFLSQHPSCTVSKTSGYYGHALHTATQDSIFLLWVLCFVFCFLFGSFPPPPPRTLIKIHQNKCFQQQPLRTLPPPLCSIKSGSSNLKEDEKLSLTHCHTPVKRWAHSKQRRVQVLIYYFTQIIFLPFFLTMGTFTSQMEPSVVLWAFADLEFCFPWWKRLGKKRISSLPTGATLMFVFNNGRHLEIILMGNEYTNNFFTVSGKGEKTCAHPYPYLHTAEM